MNLRHRLPSKVRPALALLAASAFASAPSLADDKTECLAAASKGQTLRDAHSLVEAREQFERCAQKTCPALVQTDCGAWLDAVEKTLPSVVLSAKDGDGRDLFDVTVTVDGRPLAEKLDGKAVPMNPGLRAFRFARADGTSVTSQVLVKEGEKAQGIAVVLSAPVVAAKPADAMPAANAATEPAPPAATSHAGPLRTIGLVLGGVGIVAMGVGGGVAFDAKSKDNTAAGDGGTTRQTVSRNAVSEGNTATVVFVAGAVVAAAGVVVWITAPSAKVGVGTDGSEVLVRGVF